MLAHKQVLWQTLLKIVFLSVILALLLPLSALTHVEAQASSRRHSTLPALFLKPSPGITATSTMPFRTKAVFYDWPESMAPKNTMAMRLKRSIPAKRFQPYPKIQKG
jgi:hypothetical protein